MKTWLWLILLCCTFGLHAQTTQDALRQLDEEIERKNVYFDQKEQELQSLKRSLASAVRDQDRFTLCNLLFQKYLHYQSDSSLHYLNLKQQYAPKPLSHESGIELQINRAEVMGVMGMFNEVANELQGISPVAITDKELRYYYFRSLRAYWGWMADYSATAKEREIYTLRMAENRDSMMNYSIGLPDYSITLADKAVMMNQPQQALNYLNRLNLQDLPLQTRAYTYYTYYDAYRALKQTDRQIFFLAQTAICDLKNAVREYAALHKLAYLMYEVGDIDRAYKYLTCAMEDAVASNSRLRSFEVTNIYPIINKAAQLKEEQQQKLTRGMLISISVLSLLFIATIIYLYYWMQRLAAMKRQLSAANEQLNETNRTLAQTGKIKEVYIARYLERCVSYLDKQEQYRRSLEKLAMAQRVDDLYKAIKSEQFLKDERRDFYHEFDKSFLELFPHFIADFNKLLTDDAQLSPKPGELLNTELRIFALIRLGITDATQISHFLSYSLATVYNYRSKIRNKARESKETFEEEVMKL